MANEDLRSEFENLVEESANIEGFNGGTDAIKVAGNTVRWIHYYHGEEIRTVQRQVRNISDQSNVWSSPQNQSISDIQKQLEQTSETKMYVVDKHPFNYLRDLVFEEDSRFHDGLCWALVVHFGEEKDRIVTASSRRIRKKIPGFGKDRARRARKSIKEQRDDTSD